MRLPFVVFIDLIFYLLCVSVCMEILRVTGKCRQLGYI